ncbi:acetyltransferase [Amycolatopsis mediterranei S699]|uniref:Acetyltransferase n=2 Tax=Amycolatopsis mediterranei TaxID=33910 RepID=A0A0H3D2X4_AMYMU|nr:GNAT family N-acetyltransferase [Amycolatopsis mediterranei]ADJ43876.1 acetyltransferase [Amycolatopsis mediterranei U32]AEK40592.1 acetyltransferase [Amycolatopsis mediterranei S699]AFO75589.1 acetyltransferase [Amycolatopsis mediterranei S699]AGT82718.1 acetyltransferase [Amycolatopsis mediterranei RB]KDO09117.1 acetyltransferase [Amycolatopsis mediterranei]
MDLSRRPLTLDDAPALARLYAAAEEIDRTGDHFSADDLRDELDAPNVDLLRATVGAWAGDRLVGYGLVRRRDAADPVHMIRLQSVVHPQHRTDAVGTHLVEWFARTSREVHERAFPGAPLELHHGSHQNERWIAGVLTRAGYTHGRTMVNMRVGLADLPPQPPLPDGFEAVPFAFEHDLAALDARNDTFAGHWGSTAYEPDAWRHLVTGSKDFRPDLSFLVLDGDDGDKVLAFVLSHHYASETAATGIREHYATWVGTRAALRGRGVASGLLGHTLRAAKDAGFDRSALNVDVDNAHRALGVYERCGYRVDDEWHVYVLS